MQVKHRLEARRRRTAGSLGVLWCGERRREGLLGAVRLAYANSTPPLYLAAVSSLARPPLSHA
jgi:hypothetical protein